MKKCNAAQGFSLIELVAVIVLLGIVLVLVLPQFSTRGGVAEYALRDELIAAYRYVQQRATYDHSGVCYSLSVTATGFEPHRDGSFFEQYGQVSYVGDYSGLDVSTGGSNVFTLYFDGLGNVSQASCGGAPPGGTLTLSTGSASATVYATGLISVN